MSLSGPKIQAFLSKPPTTPQGSLCHTPILLSDSKGFALKNKTPLRLVEFWCQSGLQTEKAIDQLEHRLDSRDFGSALIYIWLGTCDITRKEGKITQVRCWDNTIVDTITAQYRRAITIVSKFQDIKVKFIEIPCYSIVAYNRHKGHSNPDLFKNQDIEICRQVEALNANIRAINSEIGQSTLRFNKDITRRRKDTDNRKKKNNGVRISYKFSVFYDGIHPGTELALIWSRRLTEDINRSCFRVLPADILDIHVPEEDLQSIE